MVLATASISLSSSAQIQQGNVFVGGNIANLGLVLSAPQTFSADVKPTVGWFVANNVAVGAYGDFGVVSVKGGGATYNYGAGGLTRFYAGSALDVLNHGRFFGQATLGLSATGGNIGSRVRGQLNVGPGFSYFITPSVGLETLLLYTGAKGFNDDNYIHALALSFGLQVYLPGKNRGK